MIKSLINSWSFLLIIILMLVIRTFFVVPIKVNGPSMEPLLKNNQIMLLNKTAYWNKPPQRFDLVVVKVDGVVIIKRIIGLPQETLSIRDEQLYINNQVIKQPFITTQTLDYELSSPIPKDRYFVMGDNRILSQDSRSFGVVGDEHIIGRVDLSFWPLKLTK